MKQPKTYVALLGIAFKHPDLTAALSVSQTFKEELRKVLQLWIDSMPVESRPKFEVWSAGCTLEEAGKDAGLSAPTLVH